MSATILLSITHGFQARMLLRSQIAETLLDRGVHLVVCSPNAEEPYFQQEFDHPQITLEPMPTTTSKWESRLSQWRQYLLMNPSLGATLNHKRETLRRENPRKYFITRAGNLVLGNVPGLRSAYMGMECKLFPAAEFDPLLKKHQPDLIVTGTPGFNVHDVHVLRAAKRLGITTATVMLSWDNLTSKGYMNGIPDHLLVWSDLMADEAVQYHNYPRERIHWTGAAQFDIYHGGRESFDIGAWRAERNVPQDAFMMMYGTINPGICPHEIEILKRIIQVMRADEFDRPNYLWIRLHPQVVNGAWKRSLQPFLDLAADDVHVEVPPVRDSSLSWDLPKADAMHLMQLLCASNLVVTTSSTLSIDAACAGTPIANVFFDGCDVSPEMSVSRFRNYTHYAKVLSTDGIAQAHHVDEFAPIIKRYAADHDQDSDPRDRIVQQQMNTLDGEAGKRTAKTLLNLIDVESTGQSDEPDKRAAMAI